MLWAVPSLTPHCPGIAHQYSPSLREITLVVEDEGKGIPAEIQSKISAGGLAGVGLRGVRERVRQFGGHLDVRSNGHGTRVMAVLPIHNVPDDEDKNTRSLR